MHQAVSSNHQESIVNLSFLWKASRPAASLVNTGQPRHGDNPDLSIVEPMVIARMLVDLVDSRNKLTVHARDGRYLGSGVLVSCEGGTLVLRVSVPDQGPTVQGPIDFNVSGSSPQGGFRFTLHAQRGEFADLWQAELPREVTRMQARRYRRVTSIRGPAHKAQLDFPGAPAGLKVVDLSEEGAEIEVAGAAQPQEWIVTGGTLTLNTINIHVPAIQLVHCTRIDRDTWRLGISLMGIDPAAMRTYRRWLDAAETFGNSRY